MAARMEREKKIKPNNKIKLIFGKECNSAKDRDTITKKWMQWNPFVQLRYFENEILSRFYFGATSITHRKFVSETEKEKKKDRLKLCKRENSLTTTQY